MNIFARIGCRIYQKAFRLALPLLPYRDPELLPDVMQIVPLLQRLQVRSVLVVTDWGLREGGCTQPLEQALRRAGIAAAVYDQTSANPTTRDAEAAKALYRNRNCQALIAFGGGSPMDCAKTVGALIACPKKTAWQLRGLLKVRRRLPPLIAVPTTAGTGSETTLTAVITDTERRHKCTMNSFALIPRYAVLDAALTRSLPPQLTATTGMDALTHAVEAYIGGSTTRQTRELSLEAAALVFANIRRAYTDGDDMAARAAMLTAAHKAGMAFSRSYVGYIHAVAHSLGGQYNIPHGLANAVLLPVVLESYAPHADRKLHALAVAAGVCGADIPAAEGARRFIAAIRALNREMGIPETLPGIRPGDIPQMARHAAREANPLYPVPKLMTARELEGFYHQIAEKKGLAAPWAERAPSKTA